MNERGKAPAVRRRVRYKNKAPMYALKYKNTQNGVCADLSRREVFIMSEKGQKTWKKWLFSETLANKNKSHIIAYVAVMTAFCVVVNMFFEFKFAETQFSFTVLMSALTGIIIGPLFGFVACFLGDLVGFLYHSAGFAYMPWVGVSLGVTAMISGLIVGGMKSETRWFLYVKLAIVCLLSLTICTVLINTTAFWLLYSKGKVDYATYLVSRLFVQGQIWNCLVNYVLLFLFVPTLGKIKPLKIKIS